MDTEDIVWIVDEIYTGEGMHTCMANAINLYGDGRASERIAQVLMQSFAQLRASFLPESYVSCLQLFSCIINKKYIKPT